MQTLSVKIAPNPRGNAKLGAVLTESRPTGKTCPDTCPFKQSGECYSTKGERYHPGALEGWTHRDRQRRRNRPLWRAKRHVAWTREAKQGIPVRFLVHGDLLEPGSQTLDREYLADMLATARTIPNFKGWGYTHAWRHVPVRTIHHLKRAGITLWASVHNATEAENASAKGFPVAMVLEATVRSYPSNGPRVVPDIGTGRKAIICPHQLGRAKTCLACGYCWKPIPSRKTDLVLLSH